MRALRLSLWIAVALVLFGLGAGAVVSLQSPQLGQDGPGATTAPEAPLGGAFTLVDSKSRPITEAVFREKPSATLFGYTNCPDICPTTLMDMSAWAEALGSDADKLNFVFVTVDPERDTPAVLDEYVSAFSDRIIGITGEPEKVQAMVRDYKIVSRKVPLEKGEYAMDHTASVILLDDDGSFAGTIARGEARQVALAKLRRLVAG